MSKLARRYLGQIPTTNTDTYFSDNSEFAPSTSNIDLGLWEDYYNFLRPHPAHMERTSHEKLKQCLLR